MRRSAKPSGSAIESGRFASTQAEPRSSTVPPASSTSRSTTRCAAGSATSGSTPRAKRFEASLGSLWRRELRAIDTGSKFAASMSTSRVVASTSVCAPPMTPAMPMGPESSVMSRSSASSVRV